MAEERCSFLMQSIQLCTPAGRAMADLPLTEAEYVEMMQRNSTVRRIMLDSPKLLTAASSVKASKKRTAESGAALAEGAAAPAAVFI